MRKRLIEIISVGNELLTGHTVNTNAHWIAKQATNVGGMVKRVTVVRDEIDEISSSIKESLRRNVSCIIISGGLGPTYDDKTLQGLAKALGRKLVVNDEAVAMLYRKYSRTPNPALTASRIKMATMPERARPLENPVGHAPAVMVKRGSCIIFSLPGVPAEMMAILAKHVLPVLKSRMGRSVRLETNFETTNVTESFLAPYLDRVVANNPKVYVKSHPRGYRKGISTLHINLASETSNRKLASKYIRKAAREMKQCVIDAGGRVKEISKDRKNDARIMFSSDEWMTESSPA
ncbi:MAG: molybdenum cofactor synthesis domain-containing protein [Candidatus Nitrosomirales archaeon]|jgi:molybdenum cofactor synthesis domain-containing protein